MSRPLCVSGTGGIARVQARAQSKGQSTCATSRASSPERSSRYQEYQRSAKGRRRNQPDSSHRRPLRPRSSPISSRSPARRSRSRHLGSSLPSRPNRPRWESRSGSHRSASPRRIGAFGRRLAALDAPRFETSLVALPQASYGTPPAMASLQSPAGTAPTNPGAFLTPPPAPATAMGPPAPPALTASAPPPSPSDSAEK